LLIAPFLSGVLLLPVQILPLGMLLPVVLVLPLLLLSMLLPVVLVLSLLLRLRMMLFVPGLFVPALSLFGVVLAFALLVLCVGRNSDSEKQQQNRCAGDPNYSHMGYLRCGSPHKLALLQASCCRVDRVANSFARYEKFHSPVLLPAS
jgi:hypothetical protein